MRQLVDRPLYMMTNEALTVVRGCIFAEIQHRPVSARYGQVGRGFGHGSTLRT